MLAVQPVCKIGAVPEPAASLQPSATPIQPANNADVFIESVLDELNAICRSATLDFAISVGSLIIERFYDGQLDAWRERGKKETSLRKLAAHPALPMSSSSLYRSIAIYELCERLDIKKSKCLGTSHVRAVLALPHAEQEQLLRSAERARWSVRELEREVRRAARAEGQTRGGRRPESMPQKLRQQFERFASLSDEFLATFDQYKPCPMMVKRVVDVVGGMRQMCLRLTNHSPGLDVRSIGAHQYGDPSFCDSSGASET